MSNYADSKKKMDEIRDKYGCKGEVIFRTAIQCVVECGQYNFMNEAWFEEQLNKIDEHHDAAEATGKVLFMTRSFEKAIFECAKELAEIKVYDFLIYVQREVFLSNHGIDPNRALELLTKCMDWIEDEHRTALECYDTFEYLGFEDSELREMKFGYLVDAYEASMEEDDEE